MFRVDLPGSKMEVLHVCLKDQRRKRVCPFAVH